MTDKKMSEILSQMTIVVDTREKKNQHIIDWLEQNNIKWISKKLDSGDYSIELPQEFGIDISYKFVVERKNSLDEIIGNFTKNRERFVREFERILERKTKAHIVIESATWRKVFGESYRSKLPKKSLVASLLTWCRRYGVNIWFVTTTDSGELIYNILYYELRELLKTL